MSLSERRALLLFRGTPPCKVSNPIVFLSSLIKIQENNSLCLSWIKIETKYNLKFSFDELLTELWIKCLKFSYSV